MPDYPGQTPQDMVSLAVQRLKGSYPDIDQASINVAGPLTRPLLGGAGASTTPFGGIYLNPDVMKDQSSVEDLISHEMTHRKQYQDMGALQGLKNAVFGSPESNLPYFQQPREQEAYGVQRAREWKRADIPLPRGQ